MNRYKGKNAFTRPQNTDRKTEIYVGQNRERTLRGICAFMVNKELITKENQSGIYQRNQFKKMDSLEALEEEARKCKNDGRYLRISSTNVDGLYNEKKEELQSLIEDGIEVICLQETKRRRDDLQGDLRFEGYKTITMEREGQDKQGKEIVMLIIT